MPAIVTSRVGQSVLIGLGAAFWLGASVLVRESWDWYFVVTYVSGGFAFFVVACFLPECREPRFHSRQSVLMSMAFFFWLAANEMRRIPIMNDGLPSFSTLAMVQVAGALVIAFGSYYLALFLIRGFRAPPEYLADTKPSETEHGVAPHLLSGTTRNSISSDQGPEDS